MNKVGDRTAPCGTPFVILCDLEMVFLYWTCACLPDMKFVSHLLSLLCMVVLSIFWIRRCLGTVSKALLMSTATRIVRAGGCGRLKPSSMCCVRLTCNVVVECWLLKPCCVCDRGICGCILLRISRSRILDEVHRREIGRKDAGSFGGLFGFSSGMIFANFHMFGILLCNHEWLNNAVRVAVAMGPKCFKWRFDMLSGPVAFEFLRDLMIFVTPKGVKGLFSVGSECILCMFLIIFLFWVVVGL